MTISFDSAFYLQSKLNQLEAAGRLKEFGLTDVASLEAYFVDNNVDAQTHYLNAGMAEGINPSAQFDTTAYLAAKLEQLQGWAFEGQYDDWDVEQLAAFFKQQGLTALDHYHQSGINEGIVPQVPAEAVVGEAFDLTAATDDLTGTAKNDTINAVASGLATERTLNTDDRIDGSEGKDTLNIQLNSNVTGFSEAGGVHNVENIVLTNEGAIGRTFNATGVEGAEHYTLNGDVNLEGLAAAGITVAVAERTAELNLAFGESAVDGDDDALTLVLENVGTVATEDDDEVATDINATGIEALTISTQGENVVDLSGVAPQRLNLTGAGDIKLTDVGDKLESLDASAAEGDITMSLLGSADALASVTTGAGDDAITASAGTDLAINATINGGAGNDRLLLVGHATTQYAMTGVETLALGELGGDLLFSARDVEGLHTIEATGLVNGDVATLAHLGGRELTFDLNATATAMTGTISADHRGASTLNVAGEAVGDDNSTDLTLNNSHHLTLNVAVGSIYDGRITADRATTIEAEIDGGLGPRTTITASQATAAVFTTSEDDAEVRLTTAELTDLSITAGGDFRLTGDVSAVQALTVAATGRVDLSDVDFVAVNQASLSGNGEVNLQVLGDEDNDNYGITVNAEGLTGGLSIGDLSAGNGQVATLNAEEVLGRVDIFAYAETALLNGSSLAVNSLEVTASESATVTGGIVDDIIRVVANTENPNDVVETTLTGDLGDDQYTFEAGTNNGAIRATITDFEGGADSIAGVEGSDKNVNDIARFLESVLGLEENAIATADISYAYGDDDANSYDDGIFVYDGDVRLIEDTGANVAVGDPDNIFNNGDSFITLAGVSSVENAAAVLALEVR